MSDSVRTPVNPRTRAQQLYRLFAADGTLLYVGLSYSAITRFAQHRVGTPWIADVARIEIETHHVARAEIERIERAAIIDERPLHNVVHNRGGASCAAAADTPDDNAVFDHWLLATRPGTARQYAQLSRAVDGMLYALAETWGHEVGANEATERFRQLLDELVSAREFPDMHHDCAAEEMPPVQYPVSRAENGHSVYICDVCGRPFSCWWKR